MSSENNYRERGRAGRRFKNAVVCRRNIDSYRQFTRLELWTVKSERDLSNDGENVNGEMRSCPSFSLAVSRKPPLLTTSPGSRRSPRGVKRIWRYEPHNTRVIDIGESQFFPVPCERGGSQYALDPVRGADLYIAPAALTLVVPLKAGLKGLNNPRFA